MHAWGNGTYRSGGPAAAIVAVNASSREVLIASGSHLGKLVDMGCVGMCVCLCNDNDKLCLWVYMRWRLAGITSLALTFSQLGNDDMKCFLSFDLLLLQLPLPYGVLTCDADPTNQSFQFPLQKHHATMWECGNEELRKVKFDSFLNISRA